MTAVRAVLRAIRQGTCVNCGAVLSHGSCTNSACPCSPHYGSSR